jgi:phosphatidylglycerophosphate synthase
LKYLPNALSALRVPMAITVCVAAAFENWVLAWWMLAGASFSDLIDGPIARRFGAESQIGDRLDHWADFALFCSALLGLTLGGVLSAANFMGAIAGIVIAWLTNLAKRDTATPEQRQASFKMGLVAFVGFMAVLHLVIVSLAYGWHWWYIPATVIVVGLMAIVKRGRLNG